jgi:hypothetical protein
MYVRTLCMYVFCMYLKTRQAMPYNVTMRRVCGTIVEVESTKYSY